MSRGPLDFEPDTPDRRQPAEAGQRSDDSGPAARRPPPAGGGLVSSSHAWLFALIVGVVLAYIGFNTLRNTGSVPRGVPPGDLLPPFAAPLALGPLVGDANLATAPGQGPSGGRPACAVRGPHVLNSCQLTRGAPALLAFVAPREPTCAGALDRLDAVPARFPGVQVAAVAGAIERPRLRRMIRARRWAMPVAYDRDGAVFARYGIVDCPTVVFAYPGGVAMATTFKPLTQRELESRVRRLVEEARRRGWRGPPAAA